MANILERYGIREVADVTFYQINEDGTKGAPALYLDTLKVSTIEQTAENSSARGGKGNAELIMWDYGKEINVTLEDALFSPKSMAIMFGNGRVETKKETITKTIQWVATEAETEAVAAEAHKTITLPNGKVVNLTLPKVYCENGEPLGEGTTEPKKVYFTTGTYVAPSNIIEISANSFPGTYYVEGETYARNEITGEDECFIFSIPKAKVQSENTITLEAEGDPSVFNMSLKVLRPLDGKMMILKQFDYDGVVGAEDPNAKK